MNAVSSTAHDALFEDYLADRLSAEGVMRLKHVLSGDASARARFVAVLQEWELISENARQITINSCPVPIDDSANRDGAKPRRPLLRVAPARPLPRRAWSMLVPIGALAATFFLALWVIRPSSEIELIGSISGATDGVTVKRGKDALLARAGLALLPGDHVLVGDGAQARIEYSDRTLLQLDQRTDVRLPADGSLASSVGKRVELVWGRVTAQVTKQPKGRPMIFSTPNAQAVVLGTVLTLEFIPDAATTRLDVEEGLVSISNPATNIPVEVPAGHFATMAENSQAVARPLVVGPHVASKTYRSGLRATYFRGADMKDQLFTRIEAGIHTDPGLEAMPKQLGLENFSVRWSGYLQPLFSAKYTLTLRTDAAVRLFIDDKLEIDAWTMDRTSIHQSVVTLDAGRRHALRVEYKQPKSGMLVKLDWASANQQPEAIPVERLSTEQ